MGSQLTATGKYTAARSSNSRAGSKLISQQLILTLTLTLTKSSPTSTSTCLSPRSDRTTTKSARPWSTSRSTWSSTPPTCISPWAPTSTATTRLSTGSGSTSWVNPRREEARDQVDGVPDQEGGEGRLPGHRQTQQHGVGESCRGMEAALELEKTVNQSLLDLHKCADSKGDAHLCDFLEAEYLGEQVEGNKNIGDWIVKIKRAGDGLGLHLMDKEIGS